ncbi:hypothetical protein ACWEP4_29965 [Streptomyces sp. NPDC004227]
MSYQVSRRHPYTASSNLVLQDPSAAALDWVIETPGQSRYADRSVGCGTMTADVPRGPKRSDAARWEDLVARYAWADADEPDAYTFSVITGKTESEVIRAFGGDPGVSRLMTSAETASELAAQLYMEDYELLQVVTVDRCVIAIEWGYHGSIPEVARRASAGGGEFFSVYRKCERPVPGYARP